MRWVEQPEELFASYVNRIVNSKAFQEHTEETYKALKDMGFGCEPKSTYVGSYAAVCAVLYVLGKRSSLELVKWFEEGINK